MRKEKIVKKDTLSLGVVTVYTRNPNDPFSSTKTINFFLFIIIIRRIIEYISKKICHRYHDNKVQSKRSFITIYSYDTLDFKTFNTIVR